MALITETPNLGDEERGHLRRLIDPVAITPGGCRKQDGIRSGQFYAGHAMDRGADDLPADHMNEDMVGLFVGSILSWCQILDGDVGSGKGAIRHHIEVDDRPRLECSFDSSRGNAQKAPSAQPRRKGRRRHLNRVDRSV